MYSRTLCGALHKTHKSIGGGDLVVINSLCVCACFLFYFIFLM